MLSMWHPGQSLENQWVWRWKHPDLLDLKFQSRPQLDSKQLPQTFKREEKYFVFNYTTIPAYLYKRLQNVVILTIDLFCLWQRVWLQESLLPKQKILAYLPTVSQAGISFVLQWQESKLTCQSTILAISLSFSCQFLFAEHNSHPWDLAKGQLISLVTLSS